MLSGHTKRGMFLVIYSSQLKSSVARGHNEPEYTQEELWEWINKQINFDSLYLNWVKSGYESRMKPSIDRLDNSVGYRFDNIRLVTWGENEQKEIDSKKKKVICSIGEISKEYESLNSAMRDTGVHINNISQCCRKIRKTAGGYKWKFA